MVRKYYNIRTAALILILSFLLSGCGIKSQSPKALNGILDLTNYNLDQTDPASLDGEWEFIWNEMPDPGMLKSPDKKITGFIKVPSIWNSQVINGTALSPQGFGTYHLTVYIRSNTKNFGIKMMSLSSAYRLYANGVLIASNGIAGKSMSETIGQHLPLEAFFTVHDESPVKKIELVCHVSNYQHPKGGFWHSAHIGTSRQISALREKSVQQETFYIGIFLVMGIFHLVLFILRTANTYTLFFAMICFTVALRSGLVGENLIVSFFPGLNWTLKVKLEMLTYYMILPLFSSFFYDFYKDYFSKRINFFFHVAGYMLMLVLILTPYNFSYKLVGINTIILCLFSLYSFYIMYKSYKEFIVENSVFSIGIIALLIMGVHDILAIHQIIYALPLYSLGFSVFIISQSFMISIQSARAFNTAENLSHKLELKIIERTGELEKERNSLRKKNDIIRQDLTMARTIQMKLIPVEIPDDSISFYYKPMNMVGGDLFDIIRFRDSENIGIFISDVSGHGVQAALLTSMIKTIIMQSGEMRDDPAQLLKYINEILCMHSDTNYMTAFYGIVNPEKEEIIFCSCAHNHPYLIYPDKIEELMSKAKMIPLGLMPATEIELEHKRKFLNETFSLKGCGKILLYTDGLTEARSIIADEQTGETRLNSNTDIISDRFEEGRLISVLEKNSHLKSQAFVGAIVKDLIDYRGCSHFDDDVCFVCIDLEMLAGKNLSD